MEDNFGTYVTNQVQPKVRAALNALRTPTVAAPPLQDGEESEGGQDQQTAARSGNPSRGRLRGTFWRLAVERQISQDLRLPRS